ncbi:cupin [Fibrella sp. WM1]|uniref:cupin n=1 Tax=Fibrella musci TaxID=3242485 RepID=UPI003521470A
MAQQVIPDRFLLPDNGDIPNSRLSVLLYRGVVPAIANAADWLEQTFVAHHWTNNWRDGILTYHHYHSTTHEVLGISAGSATLQLGGEGGPLVEVQAGDVLVLPAGVGHCNQRQSTDFGAVGGYPDGRDWDLLRGYPGERPDADQTIAQLPLPDSDPLFGPQGPLVQLWK